MGKSSSEGVIDSQNRVFHYKNMYICDGSMIRANLGVKPSLTISALSERAMSHVPSKAKILISPEIWNCLANIYCDECLTCVLNRELKIGVGFFDLVRQHTNKFFSPLSRKSNFLTFQHF